MSEKNWDLAVQLRGKSFQRNLETYRMLTRYTYYLLPCILKGQPHQTQITVSYLEAFYLLFFNAWTFLRSVLYRVGT